MSSLENPEVRQRPASTLGPMHHSREMGLGGFFPFFFCPQHPARLFRFPTDPRNSITAN